MIISCQTCSDDGLGPTASTRCLSCGQSHFVLLFYVSCFARKKTNSQKNLNGDCKRLHVWQKSRETNIDELSSFQLRTFCFSEFYHDSTETSFNLSSSQFNRINENRETCLLKKRLLRLRSGNCDGLSMCESTFPQFKYWTLAFYSITGTSLQLKFWETSTGYFSSLLKNRWVGLDFGLMLTLHKTPADGNSTKHDETSTQSCSWQYGLDQCFSTMVLMAYCPACFRCFKHTRLLLVGHWHTCVDLEDNLTSYQSNVTEQRNI